MKREIILLFTTAHSYVDNMFVYNLKFSWFVNAIEYTVYTFQLKWFPKENITCKILKQKSK